MPFGSDDLRGTMEVLLKFLDDLVTSGGVSKHWLAGCLAVAAIGVLVYYMVKAVTHLNSYLKSPENSVSKEEIENIKHTIRSENQAIFKILDDVRERVKSLEISGEAAMEVHRKIEVEIDKLNDLTQRIDKVQEDEAKEAAAARHDLSTVVEDSKERYMEVTRQIQGLQKDLASLQGTIIGLSTQRSRLK